VRIDLDIYVFIITGTMGENGYIDRRASAYILWRYCYHKYYGEWAKEIRCCENPYDQQRPIPTGNSFINGNRFWFIHVSDISSIYEPHSMAQEEWIPDRAR
jgi:hypothetical protein